MTDLLERNQITETLFHMHIIQITIFINIYALYCEPLQKGKRKKKKKKTNLMSILYVHETSPVLKVIGPTIFCY